MTIARSRAGTVGLARTLLEVVEPLQKIFWMHLEIGQVDRAPLVLPPVEVAVVPRGMMQLWHVANQIGPGGRAAKELARADLHRALVLWEQACEPSGGLRLAHHGHQLAPESWRQIVPGDERDHLMARVVPCARRPQGTRQDNPRDGQDRCDDPHEDLHAAALAGAREHRGGTSATPSSPSPMKLGDLGESDTAAERRRALSRLHHAERQEPGFDVDRRRGPVGDGVEEHLELMAERLLATWP